MGSAPKGTRLCRIGTRAAAGGLLLIAFSAGHRLGFVGSWTTAYLALALGVLAMLVALLATGAGLVRSRGSAGGAAPLASWLAFGTALLVTAIGANGLRSFGAPPIHDLTTDTADPPRFVALVALREAAGATNPPGYDAAANAAVQAGAYPDIATIVLPAPAGEVFAKAEAVARAMGWTIAAAVPAEGRIEATATTAWIGFRDDVVIRVAAGADGTRVDVRSKSRVGRGDAGMNARRIREFRARLTAS